MTSAPLLASAPECSLSCSRGGRCRPYLISAPRSHHAGGLSACTAVWVGDERTSVRSSVRSVGCAFGFRAAAAAVVRTFGIKFSPRRLAAGRGVVPEAVNCVRSFVAALPTRLVNLSAVLIESVRSAARPPRGVLRPRWMAWRVATARTWTRSPDHRDGGGRGGVGLSPDSRGTGCPRAAVDGRRKDVAAERAWWRPAGRRQLDGREIKSRGVDRSISSDDRRVRVRQRSSDGHLPARGHCTIDGASTADDMSITTVRPTSTPLCPSRPESPQSHPPTLSFIRVAVIRLLIPVLTAITSNRLLLVLENWRNI